MLYFTQPAASGGRAIGEGGSRRRMKPTGGFRRQRGAGARHVGVFNGFSTVRQVQQNVAVRPSFVCARAIRRAARLPVQPATHSAPLSPRSVKA
jgi:hypothetical protein